jgi:hypothetical protein
MNAGQWTMGNSKSKLRALITGFSVCRMCRPAGTEAGFFWKLPQAGEQKMP